MLIPNPYDHFILFFWNTKDILKMFFCVCMAIESKWGPVSFCVKFAT